MQLMKAIKARIAWDFSTLLHIKQDEVSKLIFENDAIRNNLTSGAFLNQNPINKPAMNNRRILIAAVFHFVRPVEKDS